MNKEWNTYKTNWQNANGISDKIGSIFDLSNGNTSSVISNEQIQILRNWNNAVAHGCTNQDTFNRIIANADDNTKMYFAGLNKGKGSIEGLKDAQNAAKSSTVGLTIAQTALNTAITMGLNTLMSLIVKGYDALVNSAENCKERVDDLMSSYKSTLDTANSNADRVEELADRYYDLSKGVNNLGENVSLTNEEYEEYNSLINEIAEMFPTLVQGYTDEGNAILSLKGNVEQLRDVYKEAQQEAYNLLIASGEDSDGNDIIKQWQDTQDTGFWSKFFDLGANDVGGKISVSDALKQLNEIQKMSAEKYREIERITSSGSHKEIVALSDIERDIGYGSYLYKALGLDASVTDEEFLQIQKQAKALAQTYNAEIESALSDVETLANAYLMTNEDYDKLDAQLKTAASIMVNSLNADIANGFSSKEDVGIYVDDIVQTISSNEDVQKAIVNLFTIDTTDMPIDEIQQKVNGYIETIATELNENSDDLKARLGFDNSDIEPLMNKVKGFLSDEFDNKVGELTLGELDIASSKLKIPDDTLLSWDELIAKIKEVQVSTPSAGTPPLSFSQAWENLKSSGQNGEDHTTGLLDLASRGELTPEVLSSNQEYAELLKTVGGNADIAAQKINEMVSSADQLAAMQTGISSISSILDQKKENFSNEDTKMQGIDKDTLAAMPEGVKENTEEYEYFVKVLGNGSSSIEECEEAANKLASAFVNNKNFLAQLTEENQDYYISVLDKIGVENAASVVTQTLANKIKVLAAEEKYAALTGQDLTDKTLGEINEFAKEQKYSDEIRESLYKLALAKQTVNGTTLDFDTDLNKISSFLEALGGNTKALGILQKIRNGEPGYANMGAADIDKVLKLVEEDIKNAISMPSTNVKVGVTDDTASTPTSSSDLSPNLSSGLSSASSSGSSSSAPKSKTTYDWIEKRLNRLSEAATKAKNAIERMLSIQGEKRATKKAISAVTKELNANQKAYDRYTKKANGVKLSAKYEKLVKNGKIGGKNDIQNITSDSKLQKKIEKYMDYYDKAQSAKNATYDLADSIDELAKSLANLPIDKAAKKIEKLDKSTSLAEAKAKNANGAAAKNKEIDTEISNTEQSTKAYETAKNQTTTALNKAAKKVNNANFKGVSKYKDKIKDFVQRKKVIPDALLEKVRKSGNGTLYNKLTQYNAALLAQQTASYDYDLNSEENATKKRELQQEKYDNVKQDYENALQVQTDANEKLQNAEESRNAKGLNGGKAYYTQLIQNAEQRKATLAQEKAALEAQIKSWDKNSQEYKDAQAEINALGLEIESCSIEQAEYNNAISQIPLNVIEKLNKALSLAKTTLQSLIGLLEVQGKDLSDDILREQLERSIADLEIYKENIDYYNDMIKAKLTDGTWASLTEEQYNKVMEYINNGNTTGLKEYLETTTGKTIDQFDKLFDMISELDSAYANLGSTAVGVEQNVDAFVDSRINKLNDEIEALQKLNDAKQKALQLEKLQQALQKAKDNKTNLIYREGLGFVREADQDAINEAQQALDDFYYEQLIDTLENLIDTLEDFKEHYNIVSSDGEYTVDENYQNVVNDMISAITDAINNGFSSVGFDKMIDNTGAISATSTKTIGTSAYLTPVETSIPLDLSKVDTSAVVQALQDSILRNMQSDVASVQPVSQDNSCEVNLYGNIEMPNIKSGEDADKFIANLKRLPLDAKQRAYKS